MESKTALITGITGQDGRLLARLLVRKGYTVTGVIRKAVSRNHGYIEDGVSYVYADITDYPTLRDVLGVPGAFYDEIYHLAAQSDVAYSFEHPNETYNINIGGTLNVIHALKERMGRMYFAGTSELFGQPKTKPQTEETPMHPRSPYAVSKLAGFWTCINRREAHHDHISCGILFNHESEIRGSNFVTRKITMSLASYLAHGTPFTLGNLSARKDWGYAPDYVEGMWRMLQHREPDDFVLATNEQHTVREFLEEAMNVAGIEYELIKGTGGDVYIDRDTGEKIVESTADNYRMAEADNYQGDYTKAKTILGWEPKVRFRDLVKIMMKHDMQNVN